MFFGKSERKRSSAVPILVVGALALVGAVSITKKGKALVRGAASKLKGMMGKDDSCSITSEF
jgi:hypothetical protein